MDEYIVKKCYNGKGGFFYYKNGKLHREAGPAIIFPKLKDNDLGDDNLYKEEIVSTMNPYGYFAQYVVEDRYEKTPAKYYIEGKPYTQKEFQEIKAKLELKNELYTELPVTQSNKQKAKL